MQKIDLIGRRPALAVAALTLAFAAGCGGERTDITAAVDDTNNSLKEQGASIACPDEVDGGEGTEFDCTLKGTETGKESKVKIKIIKDGIAPVKEADYVSALESVIQ